MKHSIFLIAAFLLTACVTPPTYSPQSVQVAGDYKQISSGITFPETVNDFTRVSITKFNEQGTDIGVGYNHFGNQIALTLFVYPAQEIMSFGSPKDVIESAEKQLFDNTYQRSKQGILYAHQNSELVGEERYTQEKYGQHAGMHATFKYSEQFAGKFQVVTSHLYLIQIQNELYKYRVTYPVNSDGESDVSHFIESFDLRYGTLPGDL